MTWYDITQEKTYFSWCIRKMASWLEFPRAWGLESRLLKSLNNVEELSICHGQPLHFQRAFKTVKAKREAWHQDWSCLWPWDSCTLAVILLAASPGWCSGDAADDWRNKQQKPVADVVDVGTFWLPGGNMFYVHIAIDFHMLQRGRLQHQACIQYTFKTVFLCRYLTCPGVLP